MGPCHRTAVIFDVCLVVFYVFLFHVAFLAIGNYVRTRLLILVSTDVVSTIQQYTGKHTAAPIATMTHRKACPCLPVQRSSFGCPRLVDRYVSLFHELLYLAKVAVVGSLVQLCVRRHRRLRPAPSPSKVPLDLCFYSTPGSWR